MRSREIKRCLALSVLLIYQGTTGAFALAAITTSSSSTSGRGSIVHEEATSTSTSSTTISRTASTRRGNANFLTSVRERGYHEEPPLCRSGEGDYAQEQQEPKKHILLSAVPDEVIFHRIAVGEDERSRMGAAAPVPAGQESVVTSGEIAEALFNSLGHLACVPDVNLFPNRGARAPEPSTTMLHDVLRHYHTEQAEKHQNKVRRGGIVSFLGSRDAGRVMTLLQRREVAKSSAGYLHLVNEAVVSTLRALIKECEDGRPLYTSQRPVWPAPIQPEGRFHSSALDRHDFVFQLAHCAAKGSESRCHPLIVETLAGTLTKARNFVELADQVTLLRYVCTGENIPERLPHEESRQRSDIIPYLTTTRTRRPEGDEPDQNHAQEQQGGPNTGLTKIASSSCHCSARSKKKALEALFNTLRLTEPEPKKWNEEERGEELYVRIINAQKAVLYAILHIAKGPPGTRDDHYVRGTREDEDPSPTEDHAAESQKTQKGQGQASPAETDLLADGRSMRQFAVTELLKWVAEVNAMVEDEENLEIRHIPVSVHEVMRKILPELVEHESGDENVMDAVWQYARHRQGYEPVPPSFSHPEDSSSLHAYLKVIPGPVFPNKIRKLAEILQPSSRATRRGEEGADGGEVNLNKEKTEPLQNQESFEQDNNKLFFVQNIFRGFVLTILEQYFATYFYPRYLSTTTCASSSSSAGQQQSTLEEMQHVALATTDEVAPERQETTDDRDQDDKDPCLTTNFNLWLATNGKKWLWSDSTYEPAESRIVKALIQMDTEGNAVKKRLLGGALPEQDSTRNEGNKMKRKRIHEQDETMEIEGDDENSSEQVEVGLVPEAKASQNHLDIQERIVIDSFWKLLFLDNLRPACWGLFRTAMKGLKLAVGFGDPDVAIAVANVVMGEERTSDGRKISFEERTADDCFIPPLGLAQLREELLASINFLGQEALPRLTQNLRSFGGTAVELSSAAFSSCATFRAPASTLDEDESKEKAAKTFAARERVVEALFFALRGDIPDIHFQLLRLARRYKDGSLCRIYDTVAAAHSLWAPDLRERALKGLAMNAIHHLLAEDEIARLREEVEKILLRAAEVPTAHAIEMPKSLVDEAHRVREQILSRVETSG
ncbi:unnamed protein product [Amoebophrya sp. A25]|nr:unnamed protein product [Amoebophrya sp. A25]|eukprot:GSA25T00023937001.1